jgi:hypothetical protein
MRKSSSYDTARPVTVTQLVNALTLEQLRRLYDVISGPVPQEIRELTDDELLAELTAD